MLQQNPAVPVDDRLGQPGRAARVDDPQGVLEGHAREGERDVAGREGRIPVVQPHDVPHAGQPSGQLLDHAATIVFASAVAVAVGDEQDRGLDLREPVDDGARAEVRRATRPDRAQRGRREERRERARRRSAGRPRPDLQVRRPAAAALPGLGRSPPRRRPHVQLSSGRSSARQVNRDRAWIAVCEHVLGIGQLDVGEPPAPGISPPPRTIDGSPSARMPYRSQTVRQNRGEVVHRPAPELVVVRRSDIAHQACHLCAFDRLARRDPDTPPLPMTEADSPGRC